MVEKTMLVNTKDLFKLQETVRASGLYFKNFKPFPQLYSHSVCIFGEADKVMDFNRRWLNQTQDVVELKTHLVKRLLNRFLAFWR